jgi:hypothetical protein
MRTLKYAEIMIWEGWKQVPFAKYLMVDEMGNIRYSNGELFDRSYVFHGYTIIKLEGKDEVGLSALMLETWIGKRPKGMVARHLNDVRSDNRLDNLSWGTHKDNFNDAVKNGKCPLNVVDSKGTRIGTGGKKKIVKPVIEILPVKFRLKY